MRALGLAMRLLYQPGAFRARCASHPSHHACPFAVQDGEYRFHARLAGVAPGDGTEALSTLTIDSVAPNVTITGLQGAGHWWLCKPAGLEGWT